MLVHSVYFWLKPELSATQRDEFRRGLESLRAVGTVEQIHIGTPAATAKRPTIDDSYSFALILVFRDVAGHDQYQVDPIHQAFVKQFSSRWSRVQIYDAA